MAYRIRTVVEKTGVPRNTLLAWERRYGVPSPSRTAGGHRVYSNDDVRLLMRLGELMKRGHRVGEAVALLKRNAASEGAPVEGNALLDWHRDALKAALLGFDRSGADEAYHHISSYAMRRIIDDVLMPILRDVGTGWHAGSVSIAQEHFACNFVREQLITMLHRLESGPEGGPLAVCAGFPGEVHEIGLLSIAVKLALRGWRVAYLGANLPLEELVNVSLLGEAELVCLSVLMRRSPEEIESYTQGLLRAVPTHTAIALGGPGIEGIPAPAGGRVLLCAKFADLVLQIAAHRKQTA